MPTRANSTWIRVERPIADRLKLLKGDMAYDAFISEVLDNFEIMKSVDNDKLRLFVQKFIDDNPEYEGKLNELRLGLKALWALEKRELKQIIHESNAEYEAKRKARLEAKRLARGVNK